MKAVSSVLGPPSSPPAVSWDGAPPPTVGIAPTIAPVTGAFLANEGLAERASDILIYDDGTGNNCFAANQSFSLQYSARVTYPTAVPNGVQLSVALPFVFDVYDSANQLTITNVSVISATQNGQPYTAFGIQMAGVGAHGDPTASLAGSALRIRNIRVDATTLGAGAPGLGTNPQLMATIQASPLIPTSLATEAAVLQVGSPQITAGTGTGISPGVGAQNSGGSLTTVARLQVAPSFPGGFRAPGSSGIAADLESAGTSFVLVAESLPLGVTLTFPPTIAVSGAGGVTLRLRNPVSPNSPINCPTVPGGTTCVVIYDTAAVGANFVALQVATAAVANDGSNGFPPAIGLNISGPSGFGTATIRVLLGPTIAAAFNGDAVAANSVGGLNAPTVPQYLSSTASTGLSRVLMTGNWFTINSVVPVASVTPPSIDFGTQIIGVSGSGQPVDISNTSNASILHLTGIAVTPADFLVSSSSCGSLPASILPGGSCSLNVVFNPSVVGVRTGLLALTHDAPSPGSTQTVQLTGTALATNPLPSISTLNPGVILAGTPGTNLIVIGGGYTTASVVQWNGVARPTTFLGESALLAVISTADLAAPGAAQITVVNPAPGGGTSNAFVFTIVATPVPTTNFRYFIPHVVSGSGFITKITLSNLSLQPNNLTVNYVSQGGQLLESNTHSISGAGSLRLSTSPAQQFGGNSTKWAIVGSQSPLLINVFFELQSPPGTVVNAVGFTESPPLATFSVPVEFEPGTGGAVGRAVGIALANPNSLNNTVTLTLLDNNGAVLGTRNVTLSAYGQTAIDLSTAEGFASVLPARNVVGILTVSATAPLSAIAVGDDFGPFFAIPVTSGKPQ